MRRNYAAKREQKIEYQKHYSRLRRYGLTKEQFYQMVADREGKCDICHRVPEHELRVDHDHTTNTVRGLLCASCNSGLGFLGDTIEGLERAIEYLRKAASRGL